MEQIDFSSYKITDKYLNQLAFNFHKNIHNNDLIFAIIEHYGLDNLINTKHNGVVSKIIEYFINLSDENKLNEIVTKIDGFDDFSLMKRDYFHLINYFSKTNQSKSIYIFENKIMTKTNLNTQYALQSKDINYIIENKLYFLLPKLNNIFIEASCDFSRYIEDHLLDIECPINDSIHCSIFEKVNSNMNLDVQKYMESFLKTNSNNNDYKAIIDGGNVLHSLNGKINDASVNNLIKIIKVVMTKFGKSILVIHRRHTKTFPNLINLLKSTGIIYFLTPYNVNDDIFILWFFLANKYKPFIITNDKYRDHVFNFETVNKKDHMELSMSQFKNVLSQQCLEYNINTLKISDPIKVSRCVHVKSNKIYVPHSNGKFIEIILD